MVRFAGCCSPLPGDDVTGFVTRGRGVTVHVKECPHTFALDRDRRIDVEWEPKSSLPRQIRVRVVSVDQPGSPFDQWKNAGIASVLPVTTRMRDPDRDVLQTLLRWFDLNVAQR